MWDYLYSADAGYAMYLLGEKGVPGKTYCIGGGTARPLREYIEAIRDAAAPGAEIGFGEIPYQEKRGDVSVRRYFRSGKRHRLCAACNVCGGN